MGIVVPGAGFSSNLSFRKSTGRFGRSSEMTSWAVFARLIASSDSQVEDMAAATLEGPFWY